MFWVFDWIQGFLNPINHLSPMRVIYISFFAFIYALLHQAGHSSQYIDLQGHRGARGLFPENTIAAFESAVEHGMTTLELDVHLTSDQHFVVFHDHKITSENAICENPSLLGKYIEELTLAEVQSLDVGSVRNKRFKNQKVLPPTHPISLNELLSFIEQKSVEGSAYKNICFNIELKTAETFKEKMDLQKISGMLLGLLDQYELLNRCSIQSFYLPFIDAVESLNSDAKTSALFYPTKYQGVMMKMGLSANRKEIIQDALGIKADIISPHHLYCSKSFVRSCHESGLKVIPWTVNESERMMALFDRGVDGVISDYPDILSKAYLLWQKEL